MNNGRWYPSALALPDGGVLVISGSFAQGRPQPPPDNPSLTNPNPQIWRGNAWAPTVNFQTLQLYPRLHVEPKQGRVFMAGPQGQSFFLDVAGAGTWTPGPARDGALREYAPSVMYQSGKILFIGGGQDQNTQLPTDLVESIDLNLQDPQWTPTGAMHFRRRQHNATVLPDGTVLVTGGTQGIVGNPDWHGFNDVRPGVPVHTAELWDPATGQWTLMAAENVDRCYHSTALLLPDGRVLSAGGGEYAPNDPARPGQPNPPGDSHPNAQLFNPPYLFKGDRPTISSPPTTITYGQSFNVTVGANDTIAKVGSQVTVQAPSSANIAPPGHYMLFVVNDKGVPSIAPIVQIEAQAIRTQARHAVLAQRTPAAVPLTVNLTTLNKKITTDQGRSPIVVGVTPSCPYGIGACWGGAFDALQRLSNIEVVRPVPDTADSIAFVYLRRDILPDLDVWRDEFATSVNGTYIMRGIEMTLSGLVTEQHTRLTLTGTATRPELELARLQAANKIQWDIRTRANRPMSDPEASAFERLSGALAARPAGTTVQVTGPLKKNGADFVLEHGNFSLRRSVSIVPRIAVGRERNILLVRPWKPGDLAVDIQAA